MGFTADVLGGQHMGDVTAYRAKSSIGQKVRGLSSYVSEVRRMIECGFGIGFLPLHFAAPHLAAGRIWRLPPYDDEPSAPVFLISNPSILLSRADQLFMEMLPNCDELRKAIPTAEATDGGLGQEDPIYSGPRPAASR